MAGPHDTRPSWPAALAVGCVSFVLGAITLGTKALWFDEAFNAQRIKQSWGDLFNVIGSTEMSQGVYVVGLKTWVTLTPNSEIWLRIPSVVFAALAAALLVPLGARLFDRRVGIIAGVLLATNALVVRHAQEARTYALVTLAVVVATILFVRAIDDPRRRTWLLYAVGAAAAVYCHFFAAFVIVAHLVSVPFATRRPPLRRVLETATLFLALIAPALYFTATANRSQLGWIEDPSADVVVRVLEIASGNNLPFGAAALLGLAFLAYRTGAGGRPDRWRLVLIGGWCSLPIALAFAVSEVQPILVPRYTIVIVPALALAAAYPISLAVEKITVVAVAALIAVIAVSGYRLVAWYERVPEDWRGAADYIQRERQPGDAVVVAPLWSRDALAFYDGGRDIEEAARDRRTFMLLYNRSPAARSELASVRVEEAVLELATEKNFGDALAVRVYEPRDRQEP